MDKNVLYSEFAGDSAGVLSAGPAECDQDVVARIVPPLDGDPLDCRRHVAVCNLDVAGCEGLAVVSPAGFRGNLVDQLVEPGSSGVGVERIFPLHSPRVEKVEIVKHAKVRQAKLYYLRELRGKAARLKEIRVQRVKGKSKASKKKAKAKAETEA